MRILITGGTGLIGSHTIARMLMSGKQVVALVRDAAKLQRCLLPLKAPLAQLETVIGDVSDTDSVRRAAAGCDALIHCAGVFSNRLEDREWLEQINVDGTRTVLGVGVEQGMDPVVHVSSILALFPPRGAQQRADDEVATPNEMYAKTKAASESIARELQAAGHPVVTVYPGSVQGPDDPSYGIGMQVIENHINTGKVMVTEGGRVYTDVRDLALMLDRVLSPGLGARRYMFGGYYLTYEEYYALLCKVTGKPLQRQFIAGWVLRAMGSANDLISKLTRKPALLTREAAEVFTRSVPCDDTPAINELALSGDLVGIEASFQDMIDWMRETGKIS